MQRLQSLSIQLRGILTVSLLRALSIAILSPITALFLKQFVHTDNAVSWIITLSYVFGAFSSVYGSLIIERLQKRKTMVIGLLLFSLVILCLSVSSNSSTVVFLFIIYTFLLIMLQFNISLYIDHFSSQRNVATHFGTNGVLTNIGWLVGPMIGGLLAQSFSYLAVFLIASLFAFIALVVFILSEPPERPRHEHHHIQIAKNIKQFFANPFLRQLYFNGLGINIFYGTFMLIPLLLRELGASVGQIGLFTGLAAIPWVLLEYPAGKWADRTKKEKKLFVFSYALLALSLFCFGVSGSYITAFIFLLLATVATSLIENNILSYFYRFVPESDIGKSSVFLTHISLGYFIGAIVASLCLEIMPLGVFFSFLGILTILFIANASQLRYTERESLKAGTIAD
jgi:MFS family permease